MSDLTRSTEPAANQDSPFAEAATTNNTRVWAHSRRNADEESWEPLETHLHRVATLARRFAAAFDSGDWGHAAGLWHDLGKYRPEFQRRIRGSGEQAPHASVGAALADSLKLAPIAFVIAGHHTGLANPVASDVAGPRPLRETVQEGSVILDALRDAMPPELRSPVNVSPPNHLRDITAQSAHGRSATELWIRMLFSALVDADRLATEEFYEPAKRARLAKFDSVPDLRARLDGHLQRFVADTAMNRLRARVLADCRTAAEQEPGFFTLTVPTGGGKTLSGLAFGLHHAERRGLRRVIVVAPFTSIIEQNASVYVKALGSHNVIEHHSAIDEAARESADGPLEIRRRLATENWDAPIIVTTAVQFFESLFANAPSRCRKLHNVARSVVIIDEAQTLPSEFLRCTLDVMKELVRGYGCSLVLSTATQPALRRRPALPDGLADVREIVRGPMSLQSAPKRVDVRWRTAAVTTYDTLAREILQYSRVLTVVHRRPDARSLAQLLPPVGRFHLSTRMCAAHRSDALNRIRQALDANATCRVVSTQLVEAGVDVDFPVVFRAMAGLDSLAQAAGRCNRHGTLRAKDGKRALGTFVVFRAETLPPKGVLSKGLEVAQLMLDEGGGVLDLEDPLVHERYFRLLYQQSTLDKHGVAAHRELLNFATVASLVRLIDDRGLRPVLVPWGDSDQRRLAFERRPGRDTARALQPFLVQLWSRELDSMLRLGAVEEVAGFAHALTVPFRHLYHDNFGLVLDDDATADPSSLII